MRAAPFASWIVLAPLWFAAACPGASPTDAGTERMDASTDASAQALDVNSVDSALRPDASEPPADTRLVGFDTRTPSDTSIDVHIDPATDAPSLDAPTFRDAPLLDTRALDAPRIGFGPSQCSAMRSCPAGNFCTNRAPGGVCGCFPGTEACPTGTTCDVDLGACIRDCASDLDCNAGMTCIALTGRCALRNCDATAACPAPYVCATGRCFRPDCSAGEACPAGWSCDGEYCVEP